MDEQYDKYGLLALFIIVFIISIAPILNDDDCMPCL